MEQERIHKHLEKDIERLSREVERLKGDSKESFENKEVIKKSFEKFSDDDIPTSKVVQDYGSSSSNHDNEEEEKEFLPDYLQNVQGQDEVKLAVEKLLDSVFHIGLRKTLRMARKSDPFIQDAFHDALAEKLMPIMEEKGII